MGTQTEEWYRKAARDQFNKDGELEIDMDAQVSMGADAGAYVQAWVWVDDPGVVPTSGG